MIIKNPNSPENFNIHIARAILKNKLESCATFYTKDTGISSFYSLWWPGCMKPIQLKGGEKT